MSLLVSLALVAVSGQVPVEWPSYGGDAGGMRFSTLSEITPENVAELEVAWTYRTGDTELSADYDEKAAFECTPVVVDGTMYVTTPASNVIALDPETGEQRWRFDAGVDTDRSYSEITNRGVATWADPELSPGDDLYRRVYTGTLDARLLCIDAATGEACSDFGDDGAVSLMEGIDNVTFGDYEVTSPPAVIGDLIVQGSSIGDNRRKDLESGVVRAFDARTGALAWAWYPLPQSEDDPAWTTWEEGASLESGSANVWSIISVDEARDLVFLPVSSPSPDHFGGLRKGQNLYGNSVVALRGSTGELVWHFQAVHHDLWDYDLPCQPVLSEIEKDGETIPVVIQGTKMGHVFVLHRETGEPVFPVEERAVPGSDVEDEEAWPTQPFPTGPPPLLPPLPPDFEPWGVNDEHRAWAKEERAKYRYEGPFTPSSSGGSLQFPSTSGGINWGGLSYDPTRGLMVTNMNRVALVVQMLPNREFRDLRRADTLFRGEVSMQRGTDYVMHRYLFRHPEGYPATPPPWGVLVAANIPKGEKAWTRPLGFLGEKGGEADVNGWGAYMVGGAITTESGLTFVSATVDGYFRAFKTETGDLLWETKLPAGGQATPMTYRAREGGKQYVVICAGGHGKYGTPQGDYVVAYALP